MVTDVEEVDVVLFNLLMPKSSAKFIEKLDTWCSNATIDTTKFTLGQTNLQILSHGYDARDFAWSQLVSWLWYIPQTIAHQIWTILLKNMSIMVPKKSSLAMEKVWPLFTFVLHLFLIIHYILKIYCMRLASQKILLMFKFTADNNVFFKFHHEFCIVKNCYTSTPLLYDKVR